MTYLKSYVSSFIEIGKWLGLIYLFSSFLFGSASSFYFIYMALLAAIAGPLNLMFNGER